MRTHATISGSELLLSVVAIRLAALVLVGWGLTLLPRQTRDPEVACVPLPSTRLEAQPRARPHTVDVVLDDMRLHD